MASACGGGCALLDVSLSLIKLWYALGIYILIRSMTVDLLLALDAIGRLTGTNWKVLESRERSLCSFHEGSVFRLPAGPPLVRGSTSSAEVCKGRQPDVPPTCCKKIAS